MVTHALLRNDLEALERIAQELASKLAFARVQGTDVIVQTPVAFPSGRMIGIKIIGGPSHFTITDNGAVMREAEFMGSEDICRREARKVAKEFDLVFNDWELFEAKAPLERLAGFVSILANAAAITMIRTSDKFAEKFEIRRKEELAVRLMRIYGDNKVLKDVDVAGSSAKSWKFDAQVALKSGRMGLFSLVTPSPTSIAFAYSKLDDVSRLPQPPFLAAVLDGTFEPGDRSLLSRAARKVLNVNDNDDVFRLAA